MAHRRRRPVPRAKALAQRVAQRIRAARQKRGMTQADLGRPYLTRNAISSLERGLTTPSLHVLAYLAHKLRVRVADLLR